MAKHTSHTADVLVVGAGPAGATAAFLLARQGRRVVMLDAAAFPRAKSCGGWVNARAAHLLKEMSLPADKLLPQTIEKVVFRNADLSKSASPRVKNCPGYLVDRLDFDQALVAAAVDAGVEFRHKSLVTDIRPAEGGVSVEIRGRKPISGSLLIVATGLSFGLLRQVGVALPSDAPRHWSAHLELAKPAGEANDRSNRFTIVVDATPESGACVCVDRPDRASLTLTSAGEKSAVAQRLVELTRAMAARDLLDVDVAGKTLTPECASTCSYSALDVDSHVGKHTLVIGDAGGFFASASHEGIFPAMWSASIAARVIQKAKDTTLSQDVLMTFDTKWRLEMGEFLRPPNTDLHLLTPLIFSNQPMADRMAAAFFGGENI